jgi:hypothetical protein
MNPRWLFRMARWAQNPPSEGRVKFVLAIIALCLLFFAIEVFIGWPEALSLDPRAWRFTP